MVIEYLFDPALLMLNPNQPLLLFLGNIGMDRFIQILYRKNRFFGKFQFIKEICEYKIVSFNIFVQI
jgi:hypothetical protein